MATKQFPKEQLLELLEQDVGEQGYDYVKLVDKISGKDRWTTGYNLVFRHGDQFWKAYYRVGSTESQDERPWEYDGEHIECTEVFPVEKTVIVYETRKAAA